jgi:thymidylate synthase (FAD)
MNQSIAKLVWITPKAEDIIVYCARVSNPKSQVENKNPERLLAYLIEHKHWSPFEMASMCVEIETTRDISAQILRHRSFSFQEFSQRYSEVVSYPELFELRYQDKKNRQNSIDDRDCVLGDEFNEDIEVFYEQAMYLYKSMLDGGVAKECARKILPMGSPTRLYMSGSLRSWIHYLQVRQGPETQKEHREIADAIADLLHEHCPIVSSSCNLLSSKQRRSLRQLQQDPSTILKRNGLSNASRSSRVRKKDVWVQQDRIAQGGS